MPGHERSVTCLWPLFPLRKYNHCPCRLGAPSTLHRAKKRDRIVYSSGWGVCKFAKQDMRERHPLTTGPLFATITEFGYLMLRDVLLDFNNIATRTELRVQRTLLFGSYFLRTFLFTGHGGYAPIHLVIKLNRLATRCFLCT